MKDLIAVVEKSRENQEPSLKKVDKAAMVKVAKMSIVINIDNKYR